ncbi:LuxR family transcriptional regulator [Dokdonella sp.]|uniref:LuxR family transcriptional regulator n=1 Tax=Dokdonella sp. TaxID=2291710 RepID=UPI001B21849A|nr:LuxR family transcriptional regulator [Dokdonella sp.]
MAAAISAAAPVSAGSVTASPLAGHWSLDVGTLPMPPQMRPKRVDLQFRAVADGKWKTHVEIVDQADKTLYSDSTLSLDGTPGQASGTYWVDTCAAKMPAPNVLVMQFAYQGAPTSTRVYSLSEDGKALTETEAYFKKDGTPAMRTAVFTRVPGTS